ncbi:MAG TPA: hypothetical protein VHY35_01170 [Stellaceae bacterium]|nr:hypothetical protein [Stellaceae bacterium]
MTAARFGSAIASATADVAVAPSERSARPGGSGKPFPLRMSQYSRGDRQPRSEKQATYMNDAPEYGVLSKVPEVTLVFWIIKIAATTLGETGGDTVTMTFNWGYLAGTALFFGCLIALVGLQILAKHFNAFLYWATIVASTTFGTTMADFADRSLGIGYTGGSSLLFIGLAGVLALWYGSAGTVSVDTVNTPKVEAFYWAAITMSQTLGTALGDWMADTGGLGYEGGALIFAGGLAVVLGLYFWSNVSRVLLFWAAFILTRPLGATVGDFLDKPVSDGGLALSRPLASGAIAIFILICLFTLPQRAGRHPTTSNALASSRN